MHGVIKKMAMVSIVSYGMISAIANACQNKSAEYLTDDSSVKGSQPVVKTNSPVFNIKPHNHGESQSKLANELSISRSKPQERTPFFFEYQQLRSHM